MDKRATFDFLKTKASSGGWSKNVCAFMKEAMNIQGAFPIRGYREGDLVEIYNTIRRKNSYGRGNKNNSNRNSSVVISRDSFYTILFFMWLDGIHDGYVNLNFPRYLEKYKVLFKEADKLGIIENILDKATRGIFSDDMKKILSTLNTVDPRFTNNYLKPAITGKRVLKANGWVTIPGNRDVTVGIFTGAWESNFKKVLRIFYPENERINSSTQTLTGSGRLYLSIDQERSPSSALSSLIRSSPKRFVEPYVTLGNLFDPGRTMPSEAIRPDVALLSSPENVDNYSEELTRAYFIGPFRLNFIDKDTNKSILDINLRLDSGSVIEYKLTINGENIPLGITAGQAGKTNDPKKNISKYFGDALQIMILNFFRKGPNESPRFFGTGDAMAGIQYWFYNKLFGSPSNFRLMIDGGREFPNDVFIYNKPPTAKIIRYVAPGSGRERSGMAGNVSGITAQTVVRAKRSRENNNNTNSPISKAPKTITNGMNKNIQNINTKQRLDGMYAQVELFKQYIRSNPGFGSKLSKLAKSTDRNSSKIKDAMVGIIASISPRSKTPITTGMDNTFKRLFGRIN